MSKILPVIAVIIFASTFARAQNTLKGTVYEDKSSTKLTNVFIKNVTNKQVTITDKDGNFTIKAATGHTIVFNSPGYLPDTLYLIDLLTRRIDLVSKTINLSQVNVTATRADFNPRVEYAEVYEKSKVYAFSPSTWFSKEGKDARRLKRYFRTESEERHVDAVFSPVYVGSLVPLKGKELLNFISLYRPTYQFLKSNNSESVVAYINDSYKKYQSLPADKRALPALKTE
ncbi:hypothetical protein [Mucilaginibacter glaciei]|uniref:Carboxypeptidase-like protein n=1 Tax=Mucilaginibacter glaciei TaxID=2772109 RepID=A0A926NRG6_9SPHI|nr:hypothetical protein [Mucilaginibacter glaciei]MBD1392550.1 hypothetical protein [Mucilaginibacter glaciei]